MACLLALALALFKGCCVIVYTLFLASIRFHSIEKELLLIHGAELDD